ncbi:MAG: ABC transporter ATP-binding protein, partial [Patescibacteria group bacterium]|nr:ABC transporter ATP-binding protein [Patescibacteria group bacterium]
IQVNPDIMLVDEVLSVGDIAFQQKSFDAFLDFKRKGKTIIFVSHAVDQIEQLCDRVLWIHDGTIKKFGDSASVVQEYKNSAMEKKNM